MAPLIAITLGVLGGVIATLSPGFGIAIVFVLLGAMCIQLAVWRGNRWTLQILAWITRSQLIEILTYDGCTIYTLTWPIRESNQLASWVYPINKIGTLVLNPDGTVDAKSTASYVLWWRPVNTSDQVAQALISNSQVDWDTKRAMTINERFALWYSENHR